MIRSLTRKETARRLGVHRHTVDRWRDDGVLASVKIGAIAQPDPAIAELLGGGLF